MKSLATNSTAEGLPGRKGYALLLSLAAMLVVTLSLSILENTLERSRDSSELSIGKVQADWACYGAVVRAAANPPDALTRYEYYGTRVQVTVHEPPIALFEIMLDRPAAASMIKSSSEGDIRMYCAVAAAPSKNSSAEATWYFVVKQSIPPVIWTSWPGQVRKDPYQ
jgi:hypothetical protein